MGIEIYIQGYSADGPHGVSRNDVLSLFNLHEATADQSGFYPLVYDGETQCHLTLQIRADIAEVVCIHRPTDHPALWQAMYELLKTGPYVLFAPGGNQPLIGRIEVRAWLPEDMIASLGEPALVKAPQDMQPLLFGDTG